MTDKMKFGRHIQIALQVCIVTLLAVFFSRTAIYSITSVTAFNSSLSGGDFRMSDVYNSVINSNVNPRLSSDIIIVNVDDCSRMQIADVLSAINNANPTAIGLDVIFPWQYPDDEILVDAIRECTHIVLPQRIVLSDDTSEPTGLKGSYFYDISFPYYGIVNFESYAISNTVRESRRSFSVNDTTFLSMPAELARLANPEAYATLADRAEDKFTIVYPAIEFDTISANELLEQTDDLSRVLKGKIVLVGDLYDGHDFHVTPINKAMPGIKVQAYATETILNGVYIRTTSSNFNWVLAILICMAFITLNFTAKYHFPNVGKIVLRILQILCLYIFYIAGCKIYECYQVYIDFMPALTMMALGLLAYDIWVGLIAILKNCISPNKKKI